MNLIRLILTMILFVGGLVLMGYAFDTPGFEAIMFLAGLLVLSFSVWLTAAFGMREHRRSRTN
jgi:hypothetical protein